MQDPDDWHYEHYVTLTRVQLDEQSFEDAWAAGRSMSIAEVVDYALREARCSAAADVTVA